MSFLVWVALFTCLIHLVETVAYAMRWAGVQTRQLAVAMSFVTSTLLISRLSNMVQAPLLGAMVDTAIMTGSPAAVQQLEWAFRVIIGSACLGTALGMCLTPTAARLFAVAIRQFATHGSMPKVLACLVTPRYWPRMMSMVVWPRWSMLRSVSLAGIPRRFLIMNMIVTPVYTIGVLCSLLAGAMLPPFRSTAIQLSGLVNGIATVLLVLFVDPAGARITDQVSHGQRPPDHLKSVVFFLQMGRLIGILILSQLLLLPFTLYIKLVAQWVAGLGGG